MNEAPRCLCFLCFRCIINLLFVSLRDAFFHGPCSLSLSLALSISLTHTHTRKHSLSLFLPLSPPPTLPFLSLSLSHFQGQRRNILKDVTTAEAQERETELRQRVVGSSWTGRKKISRKGLSTRTRKRKRKKSEREGERAGESQRAVRERLRGEREREKRAEGGRVLGIRRNTFTCKFFFPLSLSFERTKKEREDGSSSCFEQLQSQAFEKQHSSRLESFDANSRRRRCCCCRRRRPIVAVQLSHFFLRLLLKT